MTSTGEVVQLLRRSTRLKVLVISTTVMLLSAATAFVLGPAVLMLSDDPKAGAGPAGDVMLVGFLILWTSAPVVFISLILTLLGFATKRLENHTW